MRWTIAVMMGLLATTAASAQSISPGLQGRDPVVALAPSVEVPAPVYDASAVSIPTAAPLSPPISAAPIATAPVAALGAQERPALPPARSAPKPAETQITVPVDRPRQVRPAARVVEAPSHTTERRREPEVRSAPVYRAPVAHGARDLGRFWPPVF